jgi:amino acid permease
MSGHLGLSREALLGGAPLPRRVNTQVYLIEARTAHLAAQSRHIRGPFVPARTIEERNRAYLQTLKRGTEPSERPTIMSLERYAPQWADLVPDEPGYRAAIGQVLGQRYRIPYRAVPRLRAALGLDTPAVQEAYQRLYGAPVAQIFVPHRRAGERLAWATAAVGERVENLPPFWAAFALTLTETVGAGILALPIAVAGVGPLPGAVILIVLGLVNLLTVAGLAEACARTGALRYGNAFVGQLLGTYLGRRATAIQALALIVLTFLVLHAYYIGFSTTLAAATGLPAGLVMALLFLAGLYYLRRGSLETTVGSAMIVSGVNIVLILILTVVAFIYLRPQNLAYANVPFVGGQPFDAGILQLIFGTILAAYFGHISVSNGAQFVLRRDPSGRALIRGSAAAMAVAIVLYVLWVFAVTGAVGSARLAGEQGTVLVPLAGVAGLAIPLLGSLFTTLAMGMASIHYALGIYNLVQERLPRPAVPADVPRPGGNGIGPADSAAPAARRAGLRAALLSKEGRFLLGVSPVVGIFLGSEWLLLAGSGSFSGTLSVIGVVVVALLALIFPVLLLAASRRKGDTVPAGVWPGLGHPLVLGGIYLLGIASLFLHGLVIWENPLARGVALLAGLLGLGLTVAVWRAGAFRARLVVELRHYLDTGPPDVVSVVGAGAPLRADIQLLDQDRASSPQEHTASSVIAAFASLRAATVALPATRARELKVWVHEVTPDGTSQGMPADVQVTEGATASPVAVPLVEGQALVPLSGGPCQVQLDFPRPGSPVSATDGEPGLLSSPSPGGRGR